MHKYFATFKNYLSGDTSKKYVLQDEEFIENLILEDWKKTSRCDFAIAKEKFLLSLASGFLLQKNSLYTKYFSLQ
jgi:hypothetical protein